MKVLWKVVKVQYERGSWGKEQVVVWCPKHLQHTLSMLLLTTKQRQTVSEIIENNVISVIWRSWCLEQVCSLAPAQHGSCAATCLGRCAWRSGELGWAEVDRDLWWRGREEEAEVRTAAAEAVDARDPGVLKLGGETSTNSLLEPPHRGAAGEECEVHVLEKSWWKDGWLEGHGITT